MNTWYALLEFYVSLVAYTILHMIFVIASDFVEAFNIPPLNIGIYVDKLAAIRALLMVIADIIEWGITQKWLGDYSMMKALKELWKDGNVNEQGSRRMGSLLSFFAMLICRIVYLILVYKSDNKSLSVFITLCIEGFWFGTFQMGFFAIGPEYNAYTSLGIHTMGNFIFFLQLILNKLAKSKPKINPLYRVRVHAWICLVTSVLALGLWIYFCGWVTAAGEDSPSEWPDSQDVWSPFFLFIIGAFAEDFAVPGVLPFAFLDPEKANLVNYFTPVFFMSGALVVVLVNDWIKDESKFKDWSASTATDYGNYWHGMWSLNIPKYTAFLIAMWSIHGTFGSLRCIVQSRWRVMLLTMTVVVPRATLEVMGYVGVANWAIGRADVKLTALAALTEKLKGQSINGTPVSDSTLSGAINNSEVQSAIAAYIKAEFGGAEVYKTGEQLEISANTGTTNRLTVELTAGGSSGTPIEEGQGDVGLEFSDIGNKGVTVTIQIKDGEIGNLKTQGGGRNDEEARKIADKIVSAVIATADSSKTERNAFQYLALGGADFNGFTMIAVHDMLAMFCRFVYGKFAVGYNLTIV